MRRIASGSWKALIVLACIAYQYLVHASVSNAQTGLFRVVLLWLPLVALAGWILVRCRNKLLWLAALSAAGAVVFLVEHQEQLGLAAVSGISHAAIYLFLLWYFGRTLARGREPIVTRFARSVHGTLRPGAELFTRKVTIAWCAFFAAQLIVSALLFAFASLSTWSLFVNLLNLPLLALMFAGQSIYGMVRHPDYPRASVRQAVEAFTRDASLSKIAEVR
jgi:uncharacterized membrane protein